MHRLDPRRYQTVLICDSFGLGGDPPTAHKHCNGSGTTSNPEVF